MSESAIKAAVDDVGAKNNGGDSHQKITEQAYHEDFNCSPIDRRSSHAFAAYAGRRI